ncbi:hypothetical protein Lalb_Chr05g0225541 [Lupinus albus]|uniref:Uncharacterized protein n=1 Tax=Lupinus albus TaxID=3870 RepID=A0A6A4QL16_LUPAL|nr:hypothetical protein Lalb_Chr05g0225541 [Lupinus albus]
MVGVGGVVCWTSLIRMLDMRLRFKCWSIVVWRKVGFSSIKMIMRVNTSFVLCWWRIVRTWVSLLNLGNVNLGPPLMGT